MHFLHYFIGWDVGGWNCDNNQLSRDAVVILDANRNLCGTAWRGNLRSVINETASAQDFLAALFDACKAPCTFPIHATLAIDTPLAFSREFKRLITGLESTAFLGQSQDNPYLFRYTERFLFQRGLKPLSPVKDMIGSQATKGMHVLGKFAPEVAGCGVWTGGDCLTAIEGYPSAAKRSPSLTAMRDSYGQFPKADQEDALYCALLAALFVQKPDALAGPNELAPREEGWIWVSKDCLDHTRHK